MAGKSPIEWTEHTWNPIVGCSIVSPGCTNCYAMRMAARIEAMNHGVNGSTGGVKHYLGTTKKVNGNSVWTGKIALAPEHILLEPLRRKKPTTYFVNSMGDLFHEAAPDEWIDKVFAVMALCPQHTFQVLTKRAERMCGYFSVTPDQEAWRVHLSVAAKHAIGRYVPEQFRWPLPNVWLGVSCERQQEADERIPHLLQTPAAIRFISAEPLLGPIDLRGLFPGWQIRPGEVNKLDWVIVGGESGPGARPMHPDWARSLRDQCEAAGVPMFFKQWGAWQFINPAEIDDEPLEGLKWCGRDGYVGDDPPRIWAPVDFAVMRNVGKKAAGRLLDGKEHNNFPGSLPSALAAPQNKPAQVQP